MEERIALHQGNNQEMEWIEFTVGDSRYGMNVDKVIEIIQTKPVTKVPLAHPYIVGMVDLRGEVLPIIDMSKVLSKGQSTNTLEEKYIVAKIDDRKVGFYVHGISNIHRLHKGDIQQPDTNPTNIEVEGLIDDEQGPIFLLNVEKILVKMNQ